MSKIPANFSCEHLHHKSAKDLIASVNTILINCDGVLWKDNDAIPGASETVRLLKEKKQKKILYVTNNSTKTRDDYYEKLNKLDFPAEKSDIIGSNYVTARYVAQKLHLHRSTSRVYMIGTSALESELLARGLFVTGCGVDNEPFRNASHAVQHPLGEKEIRCVVLAFDPHFNFSKLAKATRYLGHEHCEFVATNDYPFVPIEGNRIPGTGSLLAALKQATGREPMVCGMQYDPPRPNDHADPVKCKPHKGYETDGQICCPMMEVLKKEQGVEKGENVLVIGDRLRTNISFGNRHLMRTLFIPGPIDSLEDAKNLKHQHHHMCTPDCHVSNLAELKELLVNAHKK